MKNILLLGLAILVLIVLFADGGLEVSPTVSPALTFSPALEFDPNVSYAPETNTTTIEHQSNTYIDKNIEQQTVIYQVGGQTANADGVTLVDPAFRLCQPQPGETITSGPDTKGACFVQDAAGNKFFLNAAGSRWPLANHPGGATQLQPQASDLSLDQLQAAYLRNGGQLPLFWDWKSQASQVDWLKEQGATWQ